MSEETEDKLGEESGDAPVIIAQGAFARMNELKGTLERADIRAALVDPAQVGARSGGG